MAPIPAKNTHMHAALLWREDWKRAMEGNERGQQMEEMEGTMDAWAGVDWRIVGF